MTPMIWVLVSVVAVVAIYFVFVRKLQAKPAATNPAETKSQPPTGP